MLDFSLIEEIVETYELPDKLREKIIRIAVRQIEERGIGSFDEAYTCIADLVEDFREPFSEKKAVRLDSPIKPDSSSPFYHILA